PRYHHPPSHSNKLHPHKLSITNRSRHRHRSFVSLANHHSSSPLHATMRESLTTMPPELLLMIIENLPRLGNAVNLAYTCRRFGYLYEANIGTIGRMLPPKDSVFANNIGRSLWKDALRLHDLCHGDSGMTRGERYREMFTTARNVATAALRIERVLCHNLGRVSDKCRHRSIQKALYDYLYAVNSRDIDPLLQATVRKSRDGDPDVPRSYSSFLRMVWKDWDVSWRIPRMPAEARRLVKEFEEAHYPGGQGLLELYRSVDQGIELACYELAKPDWHPIVLAAVQRPIIFKMTRAA
ncbi:hypothetical protein BZA05DRAFT_454676, partial [Tricharina praecox]|uniref:uncharacterized protein n=1 Tax=Tricharina praecox TaxID=43433 RepID=UPI00221E4CC0